MHQAVEPQGLRAQRLGLRAYGLGLGVCWTGVEAAEEEGALAGRSCHSLHAHLPTPEGRILQPLPGTRLPPPPSLSQCKPHICVHMLPSSRSTLECSIIGDSGAFMLPFVRALSP